MSETTFFSKVNLHNAILAILIAFISFIGGLIYKHFSGPDEVVVTNRDPKIKDTIVTIVKFESDGKYLESLSNMTASKIQKQYSKPQENVNQKETAKSIALSISKEYQLKFDSLRIATQASLKDKPQVNDNLISIPSGNPSSYIAQLKRPRYKMPSIVEGYVGGQINSYGSITINSNEFFKKDKVVLTIDFLNKSTLEKITPFFIEVTELKTENSYYYVWGDQYEIKDLKNVLTFSADFKPGKYRLTAGFYINSELNTKYPTFYSRKFNIEIKK